MQLQGRDGELDPAKLEHVDKKLRRRRYKRDRMREYSKARLDEKQRLVDQCASLEGEVVSLVHTAPLTWKQIASALRYAHDAEVAKRDVLRLQVNKNSILLRNLQTWVALNPNPQVSLSSSVSTWRDVSLSSHPTTRLLGQRWITQRMLHQADAMFVTHNVPLCMHGTMDDVIFDFDGDGHYITRLRSVFHVPLATNAMATSDSIFRACHRHITAYLMLPRDATMMVEKHEHTNMLRVVTSYGEALNVVLGHFHPTPTRWVVVGQQISVDDLVDQSQWPQKDRSFWYDIQWCDAHRMAHWRMLQILPQAKTGAGVVSLEDEGHRWGVDLDTHDNGRAVFIKTAHEVMAMLTKNALDAVLASFAQS
ncbi:hypothetical protein H310_09539 [Aphanomyces invadans]|uniref:Uncharacterized protein n=1 Tax=Aphanomyces invadans TaxID=157072 RepID=A0A024TUE1_9STRA|nr:hypothetical protein H310_09539 [Aphanomyces invadans]ETV97648.1 hypothetical protein H310_09539 [Aphanomyces invadans]|eukprot:XP_008873857.1 hypothetical protein H310_09539 [Aphanomyces invadans]